MSFLLRTNLLKIIVFCIITYSMFTVHAQDGLKSKVGDISTYKKTVFTNNNKNYLKNSDFERGLKNWSVIGTKRWENTSLDKINGHTGPNALFHKRDNPKAYNVFRQYFKKLPTGKYKFGGWFKTERVDPNKKARARIGLEFYAKNKYLGGVYSKGVESKEWTKFSKNATVPPGVDLIVFNLFLLKHDIGKVWFDDVFLVDDIPEFDAYTIKPRSETATVGDIDFIINVIYSKKSYKEKDLVFQLTAKQNKKIINESFYSIKNGRVTGVFKLNEAGRYVLTGRLLNTKTKEIIGEDILYWTCKAKDVKKPDNSCTLDEQGRAIINEKPYMPIGLYTSSLKKSDIKKISSSPFNTVMPYNSLNLSFIKYKRYTPKQEIITVLDYCNKNNLKVIFSVKDVLKGVRWQFLYFDGAKGEISTITKIINTFKKHPAILAWYICDEYPAQMRKRLYERRVLIRKLDPFHPTWSVHVNIASLPLLAKTSDIIGVDRYPIIEKKNDYSMSGIAGSIDMAKVAYADKAENIPLWGVPQAFNHGNYAPKITKEDFHKRFRDVSELEMRSMALFYAASGAKGFVFFSYHDLWRKYAKETGKEQWKRLCNVGSLLKELEPYIMSGKKIKKVPVKLSLHPIVKAYQLEDNNGKRKIIISAIGPGKSEAIISPANSEGLKSRFGYCKKNADGTFTYKGMNIGSDILE